MTSFSLFYFRQWSICNSHAPRWSLLCYSSYGWRASLCSISGSEASVTHMLPGGRYFAILHIDDELLFVLFQAVKPLTLTYSQEVVTLLFFIWMTSFSLFYFRQWSLCNSHTPRRSLLCYSSYGWRASLCSISGSEASVTHILPGGRHFAILHMDDELLFVLFQVVKPL